MFGLVLYALVSLLVGGLICFWGKRLYFPVMSILFALVTFNVCLGQLGTGVKGMLVAAGVTLAGILLMKFFFKFGMMVAGGLCGALIGSLVVPLLPAGVTQYGWIVVVACAAILAVCCMLWSGKLLIITTAFTGATMMVTPVCFFIFEFGSLQGFVSSGGLMPTMMSLNTYLSGDFFLAHALVILVAAAALTVVSFILQSRPAIRRSAKAA